VSEGEVSRAASVVAAGFSRSPKPCKVEKTSLQISVCTLMRSKEATLMEPPARTDWVGMSSSCQLRSKPVSERRKLPARTKRTSNFLPMASGSSCCAMGWPSRSWRDGRPARSCAPGARRWRLPAHSRRAGRDLSSRSPELPKLTKGSTTMELCLAVAPPTRGIARRAWRGCRWRASRLRAPPAPACPAREAARWSRRACRASRAGAPS
jgi:hypothetical protein